MKTMEYRAKYELDGAPLANNKYEEFLNDFVEEFNSSFKKCHIVSKNQLTQFVSDFRKKFDTILADTMDIELYEEKYDRLWGWFYANHVVPKFVKEPEKEKETKKVKKEGSK